MAVPDPGRRGNRVLLGGQKARHCREAAAALSVRRPQTTGMYGAGDRALLCTRTWGMIGKEKERRQRKKIKRRKKNKKKTKKKRSRRRR